MIESIQQKLKRLESYDEELSKIMPLDYKDWWQNSKDEWPIIAASRIQDLREELNNCYDMMGEYVKTIEELKKENQFQSIALRRIENV